MSGRDLLDSTDDLTHLSRLVLCIVFTGNFFLLHCGHCASYSLCECCSLQSVGWENAAFVFLNRYLDISEVRYSTSRF